MEKQNDKIYFVPGNLVQVKHELDNKPVMLVTEIVMSQTIMSSFLLNGNVKQIKPFKGIRCGWYDLDQVWREHIFSTKDIEKVEEGI